MERSSGRGRIKMLTGKRVRALRPAPKGKRTEVWDPTLPGFGVRVTDTGVKSYVAYARFGGKPSRRTIDRTNRITLKAARTKAREWLAMADEGRDPGAEARAARAAEAARRALTFGVAMEAYIEQKVSTFRKARDVEREIRAELMPRFERRPIAEITRKDVKRMIREIVGRGALYQAHHAFGHLRSFYAWVLRQEGYEDHVHASPCAGIRPDEDIGSRRPRDRVLNDDEIAALWRAAGRLGYPMGPLYRLLMLTGARKTEVGGACWPELHSRLIRIIRERADESPIDWAELSMDARLWTIPRERFKSNRVHVVPLSAAALELIAELPVWGEGDHLFSTTAGRTRVNGYSKAKARLDALVAAELGRAPEEPWVTHDIRRTMRTRLSQIGVRREIAELVIGHGKRGLDRTYDQYEFLDERCAALEAWAARLRGIVEPQPDNVVPIRRPA